ncbi:hypothetical protein M9H77_09782 [Catharanthus roseus]|uniref:Uncharacterized protein n=1 Tax=Catharanthus roseus TaxID=4058 RepID=A0ACC0C1J5_CATRO|nr:hypothetical protein M9H77_09782 [Catharanthus roseus]
MEEKSKQEIYQSKFARDIHNFHHGGGNGFNAYGGNNHGNGDFISTRHNGVINFSSYAKSFEHTSYYNYGRKSEHLESSKEKESELEKSERIKENERFIEKQESEKEEKREKEIVVPEKSEEVNFFVNGTTLSLLVNSYVCRILKIQIRMKMESLPTSPSKP